MLSFFVVLKINCVGNVVKSKIPDILHLIEIDVFWKTCYMKNAKNVISQHLDFKLFWGSTPPYPPRRLCLRHS